jgi:hypothetical protein
MNMVPQLLFFGQELPPLQSRRRKDPQKSKRTKAVTFKIDFEIFYVCVPCRQDLSGTEKNALYFTNTDFQFFKQRARMVCSEAMCSQVSTLLEASYETNQQALERWSRYSHRGLECWINLTHQKKRGNKRNSLVKGLLKAQDQLRRSNIAVDEIADSLADFSIRSSKAPIMFAHRIAVADAAAVMNSKGGGAGWSGFYSSKATFCV